MLAVETDKIFKHAFMNPFHFPSRLWPCQWRPLGVIIIYRRSPPTWALTGFAEPLTVFTSFEPLAVVIPVHRRQGRGGCQVLTQRHTGSKMPFPAPLPSQKQEFQGNEAGGQALFTQE